MATVPIVELERGPDRYFALADDADPIQLTAEEYGALALPGAGAPRGVSREDWESRRFIAVGGVPSYGPKSVLDTGDLCDVGDTVLLGLPRNVKGGAVTLRIPKADATITRNAHGLTIVPRDGWPPTSGVVSLVDGVVEFV